jgi:hypothetical protein
MELGKKDKLRNLVSSKISDYQNELINNYFRLNNSKTENKFLDKIFIDYKNHYETILTMKEQQIKHLDKLIKYLRKNINENSSNTEIKRDLKIELKKLLNEMEKIQKEILFLKKSKTSN